jgi:nucleoside-diphosphate-sugar epimerase
VRDSQADISRARQYLNYEPTVSLEEGLARTVEWFRAAPVAPDAAAPATS